MQTEAAVLWARHEKWSVEPIELDPPKAGEVLIELAASGMCHSDEHLVTGDLTGAHPMVGGHEGAGTVLEIGPGVTGLVPGDKVIFAFIPACGRCPSCARGHSNLCDNGAILMQGKQIDGTTRHHARGQDLSVMLCLGTFARHTVVNQMSCVKIPDDIPLDLACLIGCGVTTGWGSSVYAAEVKPGDNVAVLGLGGIGAAAVQGARQAGADRIFCIEPNTDKWQLARRFGATHTFASLEEATEVIRAETWGTMCQKVICAMGVGRGDMIAQVMAITAKRGRAVVTNLHPVTETNVTISLMDLTLMEKQLVGTMFGSANIHYDIAHMIQLYHLGHLDLASMVTKRYSLDQINDGYQDLRDGKNVRGVLIYGDA